jgi:hypothetical protein
MSETNTGNEVINSAEKAAANTPQDNAGSGKLSPALKKELRNIFIYILIGLCIMFAVFFVIMCIFPEIKSNEEFEYLKIALGGIGGGGVAFLNFLLMGLTVQKPYEAQLHLSLPHAGSMDSYSNTCSLFQLHLRDNTAAFPFIRDKDSRYCFQKKLKKEVEQIKDGH